MGHVIYVVDDKSVMRDPVLETLRLAGYDVHGFESVIQVKKALQEKRPDLVLTDLSMPGENGIDLVVHCRNFDVNLPVILMTAYATVDTAVEAMKRGAADYLKKPFDADELELVVRRAIESSNLKKENTVLKKTLARQEHTNHMVGNSGAITKIREELPLIANANSTVLILGESGTGKEVLAREIHRLSNRSQSPFLAVNCAALSAGLLESELFGHEKGSFTGANERRRGRFELADGGTLLLDEITEMDVTLQAKLLRALQERVIERVGSSKLIPVDVRVIATSNRKMDEAVAEGVLRKDLYYRLNVVSLKLPSLRERRGDILDLVEHFLSKHAGHQLKVTPEVLQGLESYSWPGNIRELSNFIERAAVLNRLELPDSQAGSSSDSASTPSVDESLTLEEMEKLAIRRTLDKYSGQRNLTARHLGIAERTLRDKIRRWQLK